MTQNINPQLKAQLLSEIFRPAITTWNRLEGRPRREDFDRSLRAEIRDPLWMLCRQWQFGEYKAEDTGSAIKAKVQVATTRVNRYAGLSQQAVGYDGCIPLEATVEREPVPFDLTTRAQMGRHWFKLLEDLDNLDDVSALEALYLARFGFADPETESEEVTKLREAQLHSNRKAWQILEALKGRVVDGETLLKAINSETNEHQKWLMDADLNSTDQENVLLAAQAFVAWFGRVYSHPDSKDDTAWSDSYLEYQFACSAPADTEGDKQTVLVAEQYHHGHLDWYSFDVDANLDARLPDKPGAFIPDTTLMRDKPISFIPNPIEFGGMPSVRWWEFEDRKTDFGNISPSTSDLATLILAEFGLIYGNDWSLIPYVLEVGTLSEVQGVVVTDGFGVRILIRPAADATGGDRMRWGMYYLNATQGDRIDPRLFLPPAVAKMQESTPLERVMLTRDEMANLVWGIEDIIPSASGGGTNGYEAATNLENYFLAHASPSSELRQIDSDAAIQYQLGTRVPENWIPFIPVHSPGSNRDIRLQRASMPRQIPSDAEKQFVEPRGAILRSGLDQGQPFFMHDEGVSKAGIEVTRTYQRVRWWDGRIFTWLGRRKKAGRGPGSSGLDFDRIVPMEADVV